MGPPLNVMVINGYSVLALLWYLMQVRKKRIPDSNCSSN
jgi:hypothetical protein